MHSAQQIKALQDKKDIIVMAFESSCDETAAAIVKNGREVLGNAVYTQIAIHREFGGVVPEIASRNHVAKLPIVAEQALLEAGLSFADIDAFAVTSGPGLVGALLTGVSYAKGLSFALKKPLIPVNHMEGHVSANFISDQDLEPPFICLVVSGGHTSILLVEDYGKYRELGTTRDDAAGEAFDKIARVLGLPYPGGPALQELAKGGNDEAYTFPKAFKGETHLDFSFSGLKTAAINLIRKLERQDPDFNKADLAASFQKAVVSTLIKNAFEAARREGMKKLVLAGGVCANTLLRSEADRLSKKYGIALTYPKLAYCTDNAAMIASAAYFAMNRGCAKLDLNADPSLDVTGKTPAYL
ncbi:MAG: tRNA (adenosine(37)-N6)-threonylcarbamoyltransferase complex transferase subunit TsaD [Christensenellaceae bacterium]|nr:tRNA (adenosine(37)-N6)-threonylcarbamoyltransferase complex transferase subunit TsaD [Christensenellaceae bacterium]